MVSGLQKGRIVHFVPAETQGFLKKGEEDDGHIAGVIVSIHDPETGCVNLRLFTDCGYNHHNWEAMEHQTSVEYDESGEKPYSWHYPEKVEDKPHKTKDDKEEHHHKSKA